MQAQVGGRNQASFSASVASLLLDTVRGTAALLVCLSHWRYLFFVNYPQLPVAQRKFFLVPYALCTLGHASVTVFFVLSGYLVGGHALRAVRSGRWDWKQYLLQRAVRLYVVLIPALLLGGLLDRLALHLRIAPLLYHGQAHNFVTPDVSAQLGWETLLGNLAFLQDILVKTWGSNGPLWSLSNEFWYYLLFPCILIAIATARSPIYRVAMALTAIAIAALIGPTYLQGFAVWMFGATLALVPTRHFSARFRWTATAAYAPLFILLGQDGKIPPIATVIPLGALTALLLWVILGASEPAPRALWERASRTLAGFSYTLYLVHVPILTFIAGVLVGDSRWFPRPASVAAALGALCFTIAVAFALSLATEARTPQIKNWLLSRRAALSTV